MGQESVEKIKCRPYIRKYPGWRGYIFHVFLVSGCWYGFYFVAMPACLTSAEEEDICPEGTSDHWVLSPQTFTLFPAHLQISVEATP